MNTSHKLFALAASVLVVAAAAPVAAQVFQASGFATISIAGLGNTTTVAGESRIPVLPRDLSYDAAQSLLHVRATGHRGVVRQLDIDVHGARAGQRFELGGNSGATLHVRMDQGGDLTASRGHGFIEVQTLDARQVAGTYEGTFQNGSVPVVIRGRFEASFPRQRPDAGVASAAR
jgi:hypothetical protein